MTSVLEDLFYGNIMPGVHNYPRNTNKKKIYETYSRHCDDFTEALEKVNPELVSQYNELISEYVNLTTVEATETFIDGFRLGARITLESLGGTWM